MHEMNNHTTYKNCINKVNVMIFPLVCSIAIYLKLKENSSLPSPGAYGLKKPRTLSQTKI